VKYTLILAVFLLAGCGNYYKNLVNMPIIASKTINKEKDVVTNCLKIESIKQFGALTIVTSDVNNFGSWSEVVVRARVGVFIIFIVTDVNGKSLVEVKSGYDMKRAVNAINICSK